LEQRDVVVDDDDDGTDHRDDMFYDAYSSGTRKVKARRLEERDLDDDGTDRNYDDNSGST
jgi:hypothetical protein